MNFFAGNARDGPISLDKVSAWSYVPVELCEWTVPDATEIKVRDTLIRLEDSTIFGLLRLSTPGLETAR